MSCLTVTSASRKALSVPERSPTSQWKILLSSFPFLSVRRTGAPGLMASYGSTTTGSGSYSTSTASTPSAAMYRSGAMTAATSCDWYITFSTGSTIWVSDMSVGIQCRLYLARVSPVMTARTPGIFIAASVLMALIFACANGLRTMSMCSMPGSWTSSTELPRPRKKRGSSLRFIEWPIPQISGLVLGMGALLLHLLGGVLDGLHDVHVPGAAAEISGDGLPDLRLARVLVAIEERAARQHHSRRAVAALQAVLLPESFLHGVELSVLLEPLDGGDLAPVGLHREERARLHRLSVEQHGARAAMARVATDVRSRHPQVLAQEVDEEQPRLDLPLLGLSVDGHLDAMRTHGYLLPARSTAFFRARAVRTRAISFLYSTAPRRSALASAASPASRAASAMAAPSGFLPVRCLSAAVALMGTGPTFVRPIPARSTNPCVPMTTYAAEAAVA